MKKSKKFLRSFLLASLLLVAAFVIVEHCEDGCMNQVKAEDIDHTVIAEALDTAKNAGLDAIAETGVEKTTSANGTDDCVEQEQSLGETEDSDVTEQTGNEVSDVHNGKETTDVPSSSTQEVVPTPTHTHHWVTVEATGHDETIVVQEAWDELQYGGAYVCNKCDFYTTNGTAMAAHSCEYNHNYRVDEVQIGTIHHDALTETHWVQDSPQYEVCTECGATR